MIVEIQLGYLDLGAFLLGIFFAAFGSLEKLGITRVCSKIKSSPASFLIGAVGIISLPIFAGIGNAISPTLGDALPLVSFVFIFAASFTDRRLRKHQPHNKSLNTDASDAGAG